MIMATSSIVASSTSCIVLAIRRMLRAASHSGRDPRALDYGKFALINPETGEASRNPRLAGGFVHSWDLATVEAYLDKPHNPTPEAHASGNAR